jgi:hypothetical protein
MSKKDAFIVRSGRSGSIFTMPSGRRLHTLNRGTFDRAVDAANTYISDHGSSSGRQQQQQQIDHPRPMKPHRERDGR